MTEAGVVSWVLAGRLGLLSSLLLGILLGACFYAGLWWTVRRALLSSRPGLWFAASLLLRTLVALAGFHLIGGTQWQRMLLCLLGFFLSRPLVTRLPTRWTRPNAMPTAGRADPAKV